MDPKWTQNGPKMDPHGDTHINAFGAWHTYKRGSPEEKKYPPHGPREEEKYPPTAPKRKKKPTHRPKKKKKNHTHCPPKKKKKKHTHRPLRKKKKHTYTAPKEKEWEKLEKISAWNLTKVKSKKEAIDEARTKGVTIHFALLMDMCHLKNAELETQHQKYKGRIVLRGDIAKNNSGAYAVFTEQGSSASQMTAAKIMDIISRLPGCDGEAADAVSAYTQVKMEDAHKLLKIPKLECPDIWIRLPRHKSPQSWSNMEDSVVPLERNLYGHPSARLLWERQLEKVLLKHGWEKIPNWECLFVHREKGLFSSVYVDDIKLVGKKHNIDPMMEVQRNWFGRTNIFPGSCILGMHSTRMRSKPEYCWQLQDHVWMANTRGKIGTTVKYTSFNTQKTHPKTLSSKTQNTEPNQNPKHQNSPKLPPFDLQQTFKWSHHPHVFF